MERRTRTAAIEKHESGGGAGAFQGGSLPTTWDERKVVAAIQGEIGQTIIQFNSTMQVGMIAAAHALRCGEWLNYARQHIRKGDWMMWCEAHFGKAISYQTLKRWMLSAERSTRVSNGKAVLQPLKQIYLLEGIIKPPKAREQNAESTEQRLPPTLSSALLPFLRWQHRVFEKQLPTVSHLQLEQWRDELKPAHEAYLEVEKRLQ
jgi:hypothetical protein